MAANGAQSRFSELRDLIWAGNEILAEFGQVQERLRVSQFQDFSVANFIQLVTGPNLDTPQNVVQYTVPENLMLLVTYIALKTFDYGVLENFSFPQGAFITDNDMSGHLDTRVWLTAGGIASAVSNPTADYLALANKPCIFLFAPLTTINLLVQLEEFGGPWTNSEPPELMAGALYGWLLQGSNGQVFQTLQTSVGSGTGYPSGTAGSSTSAPVSVPNNNPF
jgi:hypothetical protein